MIQRQLVEGHLKLARNLLVKLEEAGRDRSFDGSKESETFVDTRVGYLDSTANCRTRFIAVVFYFPLDKLV